MAHEVVAALIVQSNKILLGQRASDRAFYPSVWDMFGGHVEAGEAHEETLVRELQEELGITPTEWRYLETLSFRLPKTSEEITVHLYLVRAWDGIPVNRQPEEHSLIHWFNLGEAGQLTLADPIYPDLFARYLESR
jgi:8-oxo-dGTP diphosphatase